MDNDVRNRHLFRYIPGELLAKNSNNKDYWGHHNGKVYGEEYYVGVSNSTSIYYGANKSANIDFMKMGTLNEIVYPTGGSTTFVYEANTFNKSDFNLTVPEYVPSSEKVMEVYYDYSNIGAYDGLPVSDVYQFTLTQPNRISLQKLIENTACPSSDPTFSYANPGYPIGRLKRISPTTSTIFSFGMPLVNGENTYCGYSEYVYGAPLTSSDFNSEVLPAGTYVFEALAPPRDVYIRWRINFLTQEPGASVDPNIPVPGGGLRIAKIITGNQTKSYTYPKGKLIIAPILAYTKSFYCTDDDMENTEKVTLQQLSVSSIPLSTIRGGNSVGYDWVEESMASGKIRQSFYNETEESLGGGSGTGVTYFPYAPTTIDYLNGLTYKTEYFLGNLLFKSIDYTYEPRYSNTIYGYIYNSNDALGLVYGYRFNWLLKSSEVTKTYFSGIPVEEVQMYSYNDDFQLSGSKKYVNDLWEEQKVKYARDFSGSVYQSMMERHQIGIPIETINLKNNLVIAATKTNYFETLGLNVPKEVYILSTNIPLSESNYQGSYQKKADYELYNTNGKVLQLNEKGKTTSFIWGYKSYFPVAKINGASYAQAMGILGATTLQSLEQNPSDGVIDVGIGLLRNSLMEAQVYSYTFKPLVGVTGITNERGQKTGYFYDANNRLDYIKDHLGNIFKSFAYNYRGNSEPFTIVDLGITTQDEQFAYLDNGNGSPYPSKFRISIYNKYTGVTYTYDIDSKTKKIGGFPPGYYKVSIVNLNNIPLSNFSIQIYGDEFIDGELDYLALDGGFNLLSIIYTGP
nr:hypothetical protein [uncultured Pedobacter sp.]